MRMWMVPPRVMCRKHLLGEHVELHMFVSSIRNGVSMTGYVRNNLLESASIVARHLALVREMSLRGYQHSSPLHYDDKLHTGRVDTQAALADLVERCPVCRARALRHKLHILIHNNTGAAHGT